MKLPRNIGNGNVKHGCIEDRKEDRVAKYHHDTHRGFFSDLTDKTR